MRGNIDWIPCKEGQMPEDFDKKNRKVLNVLVTTATGKVTKVQRIRDEWHEDWYWGRICCKVKAWAPLPEKYEEDASNDMQKYLVVRPTDDVIVMIARNESDNTYSFVNLTKGHICSCRFESVADALADMDRKIAAGEIIKYIRL